MSKTNESVLVMDFGGQYAQLIARRVREHNVYCEIKSYKTPVKDIVKAGYKGVIFTGGPNSVYAHDTPKCAPELFSCGVPVLGICYGAQVMAQMLGGKVKSSQVKEYGKTTVTFDTCSPLFENVKPNSVCWMSHTDYIESPPEGFIVTAKTPNCPVAAMENKEKGLCAMQFHPEVSHTEEGGKMLHNFLYNVCGCRGDWKMSSFVTETIERLRREIGDKKVLCGLSGGVDSSVAALLVHKAVGRQLTCIFVDHGLLRKNEGDEVETVFRKQFDMNLVRVDAKDRFLSRLKGVSDPERKRKIIGEEFIRVFEEEAKK